MIPISKLSHHDCSLLENFLNIIINSLYTCNIALYTKKTTVNTTLETEASTGKLDIYLYNI